MNLNGKKVLLVGLAKTGISMIKKLATMGCNIVVNDIKDESKLKDIINQLKGYNVEYILGRHIDYIEDIDLVVVSPGVPLDIPFIVELKKRDIEVIGEVEFAYRLAKGKFIGITGTNGKTTTTTLVGEIFKSFSSNTFVVGNIGNPVIDIVDLSTKDSFIVTELSSFQLESIRDFRPKVSAILNITEDHLNRHKTMQNYIDAKARIFENQTSEDFTVLNYDCILSRNLAQRCKSKVIFFSRKEVLKEGVFVLNNNIVIRFDGKDTLVIDKDNLSLPGDHNLENALAAVAIAFILNVDLDTIRKVLKSFKGVEHRLEFVRELNGIKFINDSKGTNPDASIKAIQSYNSPIVLIAGGMDKNSDFTDFIKSFNGKVKGLVLLGQTAEKIEKAALEQGFKNSYKVKNMKDAVNKCFEIAQSGDIVLLSPACASWDMYESYEARGNDFKECVYSL
ncbi:UDP-N-acetylmuramoylalanine--D-glutamate ligase [Alkalithermobacter thermoalcaliphilus JW-YL-7 = DSM 7308]|uniref:UDP-N-acetylmuramoylalanine--D-glutamate ligase n=1 Tax=Alkalithermobacter thermoalcaliphilus JW-YL-7 = DSM 7308 TaxID=1121328 RepID=A0A150FPR4_CLOPD|nr:UDP-N-acetylmuramoylalanine--D-glutamate ligase [[Clostridium] paradoxum JW-YL-7 = DSM 7308]SHK98546.1 UDP-N-acetylmuramoylalanine--D-glutamate ligase [[Clostridium] paradoxum JW-YL-7 = DSM 7308]